MSATQNRYPHPLIERYASAEMADVFSPARQARTWRDLWIALAETERELGVDVPEAAIEAMRSARDEVDLARVAELEAGHDSTLETEDEDLVAAKHLSYTTDPAGIADCNFYIVTVPTPIGDGNRPLLTPLRAAPNSRSAAKLTGVPSSASIR